MKTERTKTADVQLAGVPIGTVDLPVYQCECCAAEEAGETSLKISHAQALSILRTTQPTGWDYRRIRRVGSCEEAFVLLCGKCDGAREELTAQWLYRGGAQ